MHRFGETAGIAFQIRDDLFDYTSGKITGKPGGLDIREQKMTLPLIHLLNTSSRADKRWIINTVKFHNTDPDRISDLMARVAQRGGLEYARKRMTEYRDKAIGMLRDFPPGPCRDSLEELVRFVTDRDN